MSTKKHSYLLSRAILIGGLCNTAETVLSTLLRIILGRDTSLTPDMLDQRLWKGQLLLAVIQLSITALAFYISWKQLMEYKELLPDGKYSEIAKLKEENTESSITTLSTYSIGQLLQVWAAVLVGAGLFYNTTSIIYRRFIQGVIKLINMANITTVTDFIKLYNSSHGFKYMGMLIALLLGIFVTGVFLQDRFLKITSAIFTILFILCFMIFEMNTLTLLSRSIGIVWTSVIFHLIQTVGLIGLSAYLAVHYKGL